VHHHLLDIRLGPNAAVSPSHQPVPQYSLTLIVSFLHLGPNAAVSPSHQPVPRYSHTLIVSFVWKGSLGAHVATDQRFCQYFRKCTGRKGRKDSIIFLTNPLQDKRVASKEAGCGWVGWLPLGTDIFPRCALYLAIHV